MERRTFLALLGTTACAELVRRMGLPAAPDNSKADVTIHISPVDIEVARRKTIKTTGYNGSAPGPVLRLHEGQLHDDGAICGLKRVFVSPGGGANRGGCGHALYPWIRGYLRGCNEPVRTPAS